MPKAIRLAKRQPTIPKPEDAHFARARMFDVIAGCELQHGHHGFAEHLARRAADMRLMGGDKLAQRIGDSR